jgi:beta-glucuronidase
LPSAAALTISAMRLRGAVLLLVLTVLAGAAPAHAASPPSHKTLYADGPQGRYLLDGTWLFRLDPGGVGLSRHWERGRSTAGWKRVTVPNVWNLGDASNASMIGGVGWYRRDFTLPSSSSALEWAVRFESVNYRAKVWLNGNIVGSNTGAFVPFEFRLNTLKRKGVNRLVVRVDSRHGTTDFPVGGLTSTGTPTGGWWNYSGIQREVYLQRIDTLAWGDVQVRPVLPCSRCAARIDAKVSLVNATGRAQRVTVTGTYGGKALRLGTKRIAAEDGQTFTGRLRIAHPLLWSPASPHLYPVHLTVRANGRKVAGYDLHSGIRSIKVVNGRLMLNGSYLNLRGVGLHEDSKAQGFAIDDARREELLKAAKELGATVIRTHYPLAPYTHELADRLGLFIWSEIPVYHVSSVGFAHRSVRDAAVRLLTRNIKTNQNHPSVLLWSIGNELPSRPTQSQRIYIRDAVRTAHRLDPTRPVGLAYAGYTSVGCQPAYAPLDVLGVNDYFGWYVGPGGQIFDRTKLPAYLDSVCACYPRQAIFVTEFGAEANRDGPPEEKGSYAYQQDFVNYHLGVFATKPWLSGALYWALNEFWVRPGWDGGDPRPQPPVFQKGLISYDGIRKPAFADVQRWFTQTPTLVAAD